MFRFGHCETTADFTVYERLEKTFFLFVSSVLEQNFSVADIRGLAVKHVMAERRVRHRFTHMSELVKRQPQTAQLF